MNINSSASWRSESPLAGNSKPIPNPLASLSLKELNPLASESIKAALESLPTAATLVLPRASLKDRIKAFFSGSLRLPSLNAQDNHEQRVVNAVVNVSATLRQKTAEIQALQKTHYTPDDSLSLKENSAQKALFYESRAQRVTTIRREWHETQAKLDELAPALKKTRVSYHQAFKDLKQSERTFSSIVQTVPHLLLLPSAKTYIKESRENLQDMRQRRNLEQSGLTTDSPLSFCRELESMRQSLSAIKQRYGFLDPLSAAAQDFKRGNPLVEQEAARLKPVAEKLLMEIKGAKLPPQHTDALMGYLQGNREPLQLAMASAPQGEPHGLNAFLTAHRDDLLAMGDFSKDFDQMVEKATEIALELHQQLQKVFDKQAPPHTDPETGMTTAQLSDLKIAFERSQQVFSCLHESALTPEQELKMARLVQMVLCGKEVATMRMPASPFCFEAQETVGETSPAATLGIPAETSPLQHFMQTVVKKGDMKSKIKENVVQFFKDVIERDGYDFQCGDIVVAKKGEAGPDRKDSPFLLEEVKTLFSQYLLQNPEQLTTLIDQHEKSPVLREVQKFYGVGENGARAEGFSLATLEAMLTSLNDAEPLPGASDGVLKRIIASATMEPEVLAELASKSGLSSVQIGDLLAGKVFELMVIMTQSVAFFPFKFGMGVLQKSINTRKCAFPNTGETIFKFGDAGLSSVENTVTNSLPNTPLDPAGPARAKFDSSMAIPDLYRTEDPGVVGIGMSNLRFHSLASTELMDTTVGALLQGKPTDFLAKMSDGQKIAEEAHNLLAQASTDLQDMRIQRHPKILKELKSAYRKEMKASRGSQEAKIQVAISFIQEVRAQQQALETSPDSRQKSKRLGECARFLTQIAGDKKESV